MVFIAKNKVRLHDTDMAGILYFPRQFRFAHDAWEDLMHQEGMTFEKIFNEDQHAFVVVHAEADYIVPLKAGDHLEVHLKVEKIGTSSFTIFFDIFRKEEALKKVGTAKLIHVSVDSKTRKKIPIPDSLRNILQKYM